MRLQTLPKRKLVEILNDVAEKKVCLCGFKFKENENKANIKKHVDACQSTNAQATSSNIANSFESSSSKSDRRLNFFTPRVPSTGNNKADSRSDSGTSSTHLIMHFFLSRDDDNPRRIN